MLHLYRQVVEESTKCCAVLSPPPKLKYADILLSFCFAIEDKVVESLLLQLIQTLFLYYLLCWGTLKGILVNSGMKCVINGVIGKMCLDT